MANNSIGPAKSYQLMSGEEGVRPQSLLTEFAQVMPASGVITIYKGTPSDTTTGKIYTNGIDHLEYLNFLPVVGDTATTTVSSYPVAQFINGPTTLAIVQAESNVGIYKVQMFRISFGN